MRNNYRILIVEDDLLIQKVLRHTLQDNFEIITQTNGIDALSWLEQGNRPDIMLTDLQMPQMSGQELIQVVRASSIHRHLPILIISGLDDSQTRIRCLELGADDYITKPFNPIEVKVKLTVVLRRLEQWVLPLIPSPMLGRHPI